MRVIAIKTADITQNFRHIANLITGGEKVLISRPRNENLVVITEKEYNELVRARLNARYVLKLNDSLRQGESGVVVKHTKKQMRDMETA